MGGRARALGGPCHPGCGWLFTHRSRDLYEALRVAGVSTWTYCHQGTCPHAPTKQIPGGVLQQRLRAGSRSALSPDVLADASFWLVALHPHSLGLPCLAPPGGLKSMVFSRTFAP